VCFLLSTIKKNTSEEEEKKATILTLMTIVRLFGNNNNNITNSTIGVKTYNKNSTRTNVLERNWP
jgi:hypothetical protein